MKNLSENYTALFEDDDIDPKEYDYEGDMARSQLVTMMDAAEELHDMLDEKENLPEWCQNKISKATDYIDSVRDYMIAAKSDDIDDDGDEKNEAHKEPQGQAKRMMSPLHKMRMDKEKKDRDRDGKLKPGIIKKEDVNHADAHADAQQHSNGSMSVKKIPSMTKKPGDKHLHLHMKSYHKEKDGQAFAKKHGYKVSNYVKTGAGSRMNLHKEDKDIKEISFRPHDPTSLGTKYANKVHSGDYSSKKVDNRKRGTAMLVKKRAAALGVPGTAKVPFKDDVNEGYEQEVIKICNKKGVDCYFKNGKLYVPRADMKIVKKALKKAMNIYKLPPMVAEGYSFENFKQSIRDENIIQEKLKPSMGIGSYIKDFSKSDAPQFKGKSEKERRDMAVAAYLSAKRGDK